MVVIVLVDCPHFRRVLLVMVIALQDFLLCVDESLIIVFECRRRYYLFEQVIQVARVVVVL
jgi:hypothetical protein